MQKVELNLDEQTIERAAQLAEQNHTTLEDWLQSLIKQMVVAWPATDLSAWELEKEFIQQRIAKGPLPDSGHRRWSREEIYNARLTG